MGRLNGKRFEIHAGAAYVRSIEGPLTKRGATLLNPLGRLRFGPQLHWYDQQAGVAKPRIKAARDAAPSALGRAMAPLPSQPAAFVDAEVIVEDVSETGPFDFRWPEGPEHFERGWDYITRMGSASFRARHGIGGREVYGRFRVHSVTWLDGQPMVEGVAPDDYAESGALLSTLRVQGRQHVRDQADVPIGYAGFTIVRQSDEIIAKYSRTEGRGPSSARSATPTTQIGMRGRWIGIGANAIGTKR